MLEVRVGADTVLPAFVEGEEIGFDPTIRHEDYVEMFPVWSKCREAVDGGVRVKAQGEKYLPRLNSTQSDKDYQDYVDRAFWYGATGKSVNAFYGMIFRKDPVIDTDSDVDGQKERARRALENVTTDGKNHVDLIRSAVMEVMVVNRVGILEDFPPMVDEEGFYIERTQLEAEQEGAQSSTSLYKAEDIINWKVEGVNGRRVPVFFVLREVMDEENPVNPLNPQAVDVYRILFLERQEDGSIEYKQAVLKGERENDNKTHYYVNQVITPIMNNEVMRTIPFWILDENGVDYDNVQTPVIYDLVELNLAHYRNSADYERELHKVSIKTAVFPGWNSEEFGDPEIGGAISAPPDQTPFILESNGTSPLKEEMLEKEKRMASLGAEMMAQRGRYVQSAETAQIMSRGESSIIASLAQMVGCVFSEVFTFKGEWSGFISEEDIVSVSLNTDFDESHYDPQDLKTLFELLQAGGISFDVFFYAMKKLELYPPNWTKEHEIEAIQQTEEDLSSMGSEQYNELVGMITELQSRLDQMKGNSGQEEEPEEEEE